MEAEEAAPAAAGGEAGGGEAAAPAVVTFTAVRSNWADDVEEEEGDADGRERARTAILEQLKEKYQHRAERFGTELKEPSRNPLDAALGSGKRGERGDGARGEPKPRLSRLELMQQRREAAARAGFATGFDVTTEEERRKREERAARYGKSLLGVTAEDAAAAAARAVAAADAAMKRAARAAKFGLDAAGASGSAAAPGMECDVDFLEPRKDAAPDAPIRPDCVHLYGVDTMSTADCMGYFRDYAPVFCEWINDSSCNIVFADAFTAKRAMLAVGTLMEEEAPAAPAEGAAAESAEGMDAAGAGAADAAAPSATDPERRWYSGPPFVKNGVSIPMCFRLATEADVKPDGKVQSRWLWNGGAPPVPPGRRRAAAGGAPKAAGKRRRRRRAGSEEGEGDAFDGDGDEPTMDFDVERPSEDLREALKRRRAEAPPQPEGCATGGGDEEGAAGAGGSGGGAMDDEGAGAAAVAAEAPPVEALPPGDLRTTVLATAVPDFGNDGE